MSQRQVESARRKEILRQLSDNSDATKSLTREEYLTAFSKMIVDGETLGRNEYRMLIYFLRTLSHQTFRVIHPPSMMRELGIREKTFLRNLKKLRVCGLIDEDKGTFRLSLKFPREDRSKSKIKHPPREDD